MSYEEFVEIRKQECYYCEKETEKTGSCIDRLESKGIYEKIDCCSCCHTCNSIKGSALSAKEFKHYHALKIANTTPNNAGDVMFHDFERKISLAKAYGILMRRRGREELELTIDFEKYKEIIKDNRCHYCKAYQNMDTH